MKILMKLSDNRNATVDTENVVSFSSGRTCRLNVKDASFKAELGGGRTLYLFGELFYFIKDNARITMLGKDDGAVIEKIFRKYELFHIIPRLEGQYAGVIADNKKREIKIFSDRYAREDVFYAVNGNDFYLGTDMDPIFKEVNPEYDQRMLVHLFSVYGWYAPKGFTIYKNVKRLKVGEILTVGEKGIKNEEIPFEPFKIEEYTDKALETYYRFLKESILSRVGGRKRVWVSSSSGWDSSTILGILADELGPKNVGMVTGSMRYSEKTDVINKFEIDKIKKIGKFYGINPTIADFDFKSKAAPRYWQRVLPYYKARHMYAYVTYNYSRISDAVLNAAGSGETVFNGEVSDSLHNFGFSQFATFFHTKKPFTEYADKMNCYLYGPSFFSKVLRGNYEKDKVFQIFTRMLPNVSFTAGLKKREDVIKSYLFPFFYGSPRVPFAKTCQSRVTTEKAKRMLYNFPFGEYVPEISTTLDEKNIYSWLIYLYHSFHAQGSTVSTQKYAMALNGHRWRSPFNDYRLIEFLSKAPESWGRGLELNNTKYPLKRTVESKIKFPYKLLEEGPHSYLYDVIEGFSLTAEITYNSGVTDFFKNAVANADYKELLSEEYFNLGYLDNLVRNYLKGNKVSGDDFNNLVSLITLCVTGWY